MIFNRGMGRILGVQLNAAERKALEEEVDRQCREKLKEYDQNHIEEISAMLLYTLHEVFGFGEQRLKKFYWAFDEQMDALLQRYEMGMDDKLWLCSRKLKEIGIDINEWNRERFREEDPT